MSANVYENVAGEFVSLEADSSRFLTYSSPAAHLLSKSGHVAPLLKLLQ